MRFVAFGTGSPWGGNFASLQRRRERLPGVSAWRPTLPGNASRAVSQPCGSPPSAAEGPRPVVEPRSQVPMYHDDTIGLAALREQYKKDERLRGPAEGARSKPSNLRRPTPRDTSCDAVALDVSGPLKPPFFTREALEAHNAAQVPASARSSVRSALRSGPPSARSGQHTARSGQHTARSSQPPASARLTARTARSTASTEIPKSQRSYAGHHIHVPPPQSARSEDILETVRSDWDTARVERKYAKLQKEKADILARIAEVDAQLEAQSAKAEPGFGRRKREHGIHGSHPTGLHPA